MKCHPIHHELGNERSHKAEGCNRHDLGQLFGGLLADHDAHDGTTHNEHHTEQSGEEGVKDETFHPEFSDKRSENGAEHANQRGQSCLFLSGLLGEAFKNLTHVF